MEVKPIRVGAVPKDAAEKKLTDVSFRIVSRAAQLKPDGEPLKHSFQLFLGPKQPALLANYGPPDAPLGALVYYGWFGWVAEPMLWLLHGFYSLVHNYGVAIVMLTVLVRGCMFPLSRKQAVSAQKMQELQPQIKQIAEKYKKEPEKRTKAQQELFHKHNYNPFGGCLLMFIQLPIFMGLYRSLMVDVELRQAPLISDAIRWCSNLAAPDMLYDWSRVHARLRDQRNRHVRAGPVFEPVSAGDDRPVHLAAEDVHAAADRRAGRHAAEDDAVHDDFHGHHVLQSGQRLVSVLHRLEHLGHHRAEAVASAANARRCRRSRRRRSSGPSRVATATAAAASAKNGDASRQAR